MGRNVAEARLQLAATVGLDSGDLLSYEVDWKAFLAPREIDLSRLRVGWTEDFGVCDVDDDIRRTFRRKLEAMGGMFAVCEPIDVDFADAHRAFDVIRAESFVAGLRAAYENDPESCRLNCGKCLVRSGFRGRAVVVGCGLPCFIPSAEAALCSLSSGR
jgi:Asp-tRNA(Asn)/Glu-tRNA(Gln) amidotransferase A subunit family amidase